MTSRPVSDVSNRPRRDDSAVRSSSGGSGAASARLMRKTFVCCADRTICTPVFVSSTFLDMHAERDVPRDIVFPRLEGGLRSRRAQARMARSAARCRGRRHGIGARTQESDWRVRRELSAGDRTRDVRFLLEIAVGNVHTLAITGISRRGPCVTIRTAPYADWPWLLLACCGRGPIFEGQPLESRKVLHVGGHQD